MENLFGVSMSSIMAVMLVLLFFCIAVVAFIAVRRPVIFKLGVRNIPRRKAQTSLIVVGLMLATLIIAAALGTGDTLNHSVSAGVYKSLGAVDELVVYSNSGDGEGGVDAAFTQTLPVSAVDTVTQALEGDENVDAIAGILFSQAPVMNIGTNQVDQTTPFEQLPSLNVARQSEPTVILAGIDQHAYEAFGGLKTVEGDEFNYAALGSDGVVLSETSGEDLDATAGDTIALSLNNQTFYFTVKAIAPDSPLTGSVSGNEPAMMVGLETLQQMTGNEGRISAVAISNKGGDREGVKYSDEIVDKLQPVLASQEMGVNPIKADFVEIAEFVANVFVTFFIIFGLFSIAVGILLIVLIFTMLAAERRAEMGMERAVGAQRGALIQQFIAEGTGYALLAGLLGTTLGALTAAGIAWGLSSAFGDFISIEPYVTPRSLVIAYSLGVVITFLTISLASWRVSRLNIVSAVRDIPDAYQAHKNKRQLLWGIVMTLAGALLLIWGQSIEQLFAFGSGMTLLPFGVAAIITYFGFKPRWVLTAAGLITLVFWLLPEEAFQALFGEMSGDIEMFFVSGICIIAAATIVIVQNLDALLGLVEHLGSRFRGKLPAVRLAIAYPGSAKGRTGMTIAMFGLIVFSLVMISAINTNFAAAFLGDDATAGWSVRVDVPSSNPVQDFSGTVAAKGVDTSQFEGVGVVRQPDQFATRLRNTTGDDLDWSNYTVNTTDEGFLESSNLEFSGRANGYDSDEAIIEAMKTDPSVAVIDSFALAGMDDFDGGDGFELNDLTSADKTFDAPVIDVSGAHGQPTQIKIIGVIDSKISTLSGLYLGPPTAAAVFPNAGPAYTSYFVKLASGANGEQVATDLERVLLPNGAQAVDIYQQMEDGQAQQKSFLYILMGFMGLGLIVGIAAVGVIAMRAVVERRQQIGMMRALGFQKSMVAQAFVIESGVIVVLGVVSGAVLGLILAWELMTSDSFTDGGTGTGFIVPWLEISVTLVTAIVAALLMAWLPARQASQVLPAEALRYE